jgi:tRNA threonylcarbamoyladenosine biosynthesis protein TsaE
MSTVKIWRMHSTSSGDTEELGAAIGSRLKGGEILELISDLGGGKTTFTRGLVRGAGSGDTVASPTYTISREYTAPNIHIIHFDFYRLSEAGVMAEELREVLDDPHNVTVIEWGDIVRDILPEHTLRITIAAAGEGERDISCQYRGTLSYLLEAGK